MPEEPRERSDDERSSGTGPVGTMLGWSLGPVGAAVGSVVDDDRFAFKLSFGAGAGGTDDDGLDDATTIEIADDRGTEETDGAAGNGEDTGSSVADDGDD